MTRILSCGTEVKATYFPTLDG